jgi:hypothetical protein
MNLLARPAYLSTISPTDHRVLTPTIEPTAMESLQLSQVLADLSNLGVAVRCLPSPPTTAQLMTPIYARDTANMALSSHADRCSPGTRSRRRHRKCQQSRRLQNY